MDKNAPPQNIEAERSVLGAVLLDSSVIVQIADILLAEHFYTPQHQAIFDSMLELYHHAKPIDVVTLTAELKQHKKLQLSGGGAYFSELIAGVPTSAHVAEYAQIVREAAIRRSLIKFAGELAMKAKGEDSTLEDVLNEVEAAVFNLSINASEADFTTSAQLIQMYFERAEEYAKNPNPIRGIETGLAGLDGILGGLHPSDLLILAARPAVGKSSLALDIARHAAVNGGKSVAYFSLEMPEIQVIERMIAQQINVNMWDLRMFRLTDEAYARFAEGADLLSRAKINVDDTPGVSINQLRSKARRLKLDVGLDLLIIDYLQLMQGSGNRKNDSRANEVSEISRSLKILARELEVPIIALSQLNRSVESRNDHRPQLSDLRESGSIEQDADVVMFLHREKSYNPETERPDAVDVIVAKHRNGPVGIVELKFIEHSTKFVDKA
jgi:replicative DNA helicase